VRIHPTWHTTRKALTATAIAAVLGGGAFLGGGTASASTLLANGCSGSVSGNMGDQIAVQGSTLADTVKTAAAAKKQTLLWIIPLNGVDPDGLAKAITAKGAVIIGEIPNAAGGSIGGDVVSAAVSQALNGNAALGWSADTKTGVLQAISTAVTKACGLNTLALNYAAPTTSPSSSSPTSSYGQPPATDGNGGVLLGSGSASAPQRNYSGIPTAVAPGFAVPPGVRYPAAGGIPGQPAPEYGLPGDGGSQQQSSDVRNAGNASALAAPDSSLGGVQLPMLLAVMALAGVTAALVRTWVLRRVS
jgi:hypothetical protein